jgi:hypothetical protein
MDRTLTANSSLSLMMGSEVAANGKDTKVEVGGLVPSWLALVLSPNVCIDQRSRRREFSAVALPDRALYLPSRSLESASEPGSGFRVLASLESGAFKFAETYHKAADQHPSAMATFTRGPVASHPGADSALLQMGHWLLLRGIKSTTRGPPTASLWPLITTSHSILRDCRTTLLNSTTPHPLSNPTSSRGARRKTSNIQESKTSTNGSFQAFNTDRT